MAREKTRASNLAACVLIFVNGVTMICSTLLFTASLWVIASPDTFLFAIRMFGNEYLKVLVTEQTATWQLGVCTALVASVAFFISFMGVYGAFICSQFLLFMYSTLVILLLLLECALVFYFSSDLVEKGVKEQDGQLAHAVRLALDCCGYNMTSEEQTVVALPWSCCGVEGYPSNCTPSRSFRKDCKQSLKEWSDVYEIPLYVGLTAFHVLMASCSLLRRACSASRPHT